MTEAFLREAAAEVYKREFSEFSDPPARRFSLRHRMKMKKIFALYQKNAGGTFTPARRLTARLVLRCLAIVLMAALTLAVCAAVIESFTETVYGDRSEARAAEWVRAGALEEIDRLTEISND